MSVGPLPLDPRSNELSRYTGEVMARHSDGAPPPAATGRHRSRITTLNSLMEWAVIVHVYQKHMQYILS